jgi:NADP-dependent 3-hydroxy acid dehydrogenase YdfG
MIMVIAGPLTVFVLVCQALYTIVQWCTGWDQKQYYHPQKMQQQQQQPQEEEYKKELAVVITGCDSGFGKEFALWAADAGYVVFAGCLSKASFVNFDDTSIRPLVMDVTKDDDVSHAVRLVQHWIDEAQRSSSSSPSSQPKRRVLHALCNNAGIGVLAPIDLMKLSEIENIMQGMLLSLYSLDNVV